MTYPTVVTLSNRINPDGTLQKDVRRRVDLSIIVYQDESGQTLTMSGGYADREAPFTHAEAMRRYAIQHRVPEGAILKEEESLDTIGQAYFVKRKIIVPRNWNRFIVVSSDYHMRRVREIFDFIFGPEFLIEYRNALTLLRFNPKVLLEERLKSEIFKRFSRGIKPGNDNDIDYKIFAEHPLYKK